MVPSLDHLELLLLQYKYWVLFPIALVEGPIITVFAGAAISLGYLGWVPSIIIISLGDIIGDIGHYYIGLWGGKFFIKKYGKYIGLKESHIVYMEKVLGNHPGKSLLLGKLAHGAGGALLVAAGMVKMSIKKFIYWNTLGTIPKTIGLLVLGFYFTNAITKINNMFEVIASVTIIVAILIIFIWLKFYQKKVQPES